VPVESAEPGRVDPLGVPGHIDPPDFPVLEAVRAVLRSAVQQETLSQEDTIA
jgi:hypothetical protein